MYKATNSNIFIPDYWPLFQTEEKRIFKYTCPDGTEISFNSEFSYDASKKSMRFESFDENSNWLNTWFYQHRPGFGLAEWRDDHPLDGWRRHIFGAKDRHVFALTFCHPEIRLLWWDWRIQNDYIAIAYEQAWQWSVCIKIMVYFTKSVAILELRLCYQKTY